MFVEPTFSRSAEISSKGQGGVRWVEGESHRCYGRDRCCTAIVRILWWWKRERSLIGELSSDLKVMFLWGRRFRGEATAAVGYVQQWYLKPYREHDRRQGVAAAYVHGDSVT